MKTLHLNPAAGISGDMFAGALLDLGASESHLRAELAKLKLNFELRVTKVMKIDREATRFEVLTEPEHAHRHLEDIERILNAAGLDPEVVALARAIFMELGQAEARAHDTDLRQVHFHEVGAVDSIVDIVAAAVLVRDLAPEWITSAPVADGRGRIRFSHGETELPVPAVRELLRAAPMRRLDIPKELTTPTGAAIVKTLVHEFADAPNFLEHRAGFGAGMRDLPVPNVLEIWFGEAVVNPERKVLLETNIDDMNPEFYPHIIDRLVQAGAVDAFIRPCVMKKNRVGAQLTVLARETDQARLIEMIFAETSTFGIRVNRLARVELEREVFPVDTPYGPLPIKIGRYHGQVTTAAPEYEDCRRAAEKHHAPLKAVYDAAKAAAAHVHPHSHSHGGS